MLATAYKKLPWDILVKKKITIAKYFVLSEILNSYGLVKLITYENSIKLDTFLRFATKYITDVRTTTS